jgi:hypothetical protein
MGCVDNILHRSTKLGYGIQINPTFGSWIQILKLALILDIIFNTPKTITFDFHMHVWRIGRHW